MCGLIGRLCNRLPKGIGELGAVRPTLWRKRKDVLSSFAMRASNRPVEATNGELEASYTASP